ncbi:MAG: hypothetical protein P4K83_08910 [Terracidiphilus sp.]|nr:hypothetical protein [Terracidiphilus sp.]
MSFVPILWTIWGLLVIIMAALHIYRSSLTKDEEDQVFLDDSFEHEKAEQVAIVAKVNKVEPILKTFEWLAAAMTVIVIVYYVYEMVVKQLHLF